MLVAIKVVEKKNDAGQFETADTIVFRNRYETEDATSKLLLMLSDEGITAAELQKVVSEKTKIDASTPITEYKPDFINGWIMKYWEQIKNMILTSRNDEKGGNDNV